jgi:GNAT superfamily N-acetyltransferase
VAGLALTRPTLACGRGIAPAILKILEDEARERGVCRIWLEGSKWGLPVYKKYGFSENHTILTIETGEEAEE